MASAQSGSIRLPHLTLNACVSNKKTSFKFLGGGALPELFIIYRIGKLKEKQIK